jgi:hypothetical protein
VFGYVYDSYNKNPDSTDRPVVGATIRVDGFPEANAVTHDNGYFILKDMPAPEFFVHIDGSTATNAPPGTVYATVGKAFHSVAGRSSQLTMDGQAFNIYLPPMSMGDIKPLSSTANTDVSFGTAGKAKLVEMFPNMNPAVWDQTKVTFPANSAIDETGKPATQAAIIPVPADRLPAPLSPGLNHQLDIAIVATGATNFDTPAPACFPNLPDPDTGRLPAPGEKMALMSFNHDTGQWEVAGSMTVSADGKMVCTDSGVGILAPGWHWWVSPPTTTPPPPPPPPPPCPPGTKPNPALPICLKDCLEDYSICVGFSVAGGIACAVLTLGGCSPLTAVAIAACTVQLTLCTLRCPRDNPKCIPMMSLTSTGLLRSGPLDTTGTSNDPVADQILQISRQILALAYPYAIAGQQIPPNVQDQVDSLTAQANTLAGGNAEQYLRNYLLQLDQAAADLGEAEGNAPSYPILYMATIQRSGVISFYAAKQARLVNTLCSYRKAGRC